MRFAVALLLLGGTASADHANALDEIGLTGVARVQADYEHADGSDGVAVIPALRLSFGKGEQQGFLTLALPAGWVRQSTTVLGDAMAQLGTRIGAQSIIALRFTAPTAPSIGDPGKAALALALPRVSDPELFLPDATSLELVADHRWDRATTWLQLEAGAMVRWDPDAEAVARFTAAGGIAVEDWLDLTASFVTRTTFHPDSEHFVHSLVLGAIVHSPCVGQIAVRIDVPIDDSARTHNRFVAGVSFTY